MGFRDPSWLWALIAVPVVALVAWRGAVTALARLARLVWPDHQAAAARAPSRGRTALRIALCLAALASLAVALARPRWDPRPREVVVDARDICIVVDVSRSMLSTDSAPNRLERAKLWIKDLAAARPTDRFALVAFAGSAIVKCPLTTDHDFFRLALEDLSRESVTRGGTLIGDAIRVALADVLTPDRGGASAGGDIILITDGGDQESFPVQAAQDAAERGVRIIILGVGDDSAGAIVPEVKFQGQDVISRLDAPLLDQVARSSDGGVFLNVATGDIELDKVYASLARGPSTARVQAGERFEYTEGFQWALALAAMLLVMEGFIRARRA